MGDIFYKVTPLVGNVRAKGRTVSRQAFDLVKIIRFSFLGYKNIYSYFSRTSTVILLIHKQPFVRETSVDADPLLSK